MCIRDRDNGELTIPCSFEGDVKAVLLGGEKTVNMSQDLSLIHI